MIKRKRKKNRIIEGRPRRLTEEEEDKGKHRNKKEQGRRKRIVESGR
jgi:hypothetical protein